MSIKLAWFSDSQHGWLRVPISDVQIAMMQGLALSRYSYQSGKYAYLEEDLDAGKYIEFRQFSEEQRKSWKHSWRNGSSHIRNMERLKLWENKN